MSYISTMVHDIYGIEIEELSKVGVYAIYHEDKPDRLYIGSTATIATLTNTKPSHIGFYKRFYDHVRELKKGKHHAKYLQNTVNKYGIKGLRFKILEACDKCSSKDIRSLEQKYLDELKPVYNALKTVYPRGRKWTLAERQKASAKMKGKALHKSIYEKQKVNCIQLDDMGNVINTFESLKEAQEKTGIDYTSISRCIQGKRKTAGGYVWKQTHPEEAKVLDLSKSRES